MFILQAADSTGQQSSDLHSKGCILANHKGCRHNFSKGKLWFQRIPYRLQQAEIRKLAVALN